MKIILTGFDPFGNETVNPALEAVKKVRPPEGLELVTMELPTVFGDCADILEQAIAAEQPQAVLCVGQAGGRSTVTLERIAINRMDADLPDNHGFQPLDLPVVPGGPDGIFSTIPVKKVIAGILAAGVPCGISNTAGTFVCNALLYRVLYFCRQQGLATRAGFLHVPFLSSQAQAHPGYPSMELSQMITALEAALRALM